MDTDDAVVYDRARKLAGNIVLVDQKYRCDLCDHISNTRTHLKSHKRSIHDIDVCWHACSDCKYKTKRPADLNRHTIYVHDALPVEYTKTTLYCAVCDFSSTVELTFIKHNMFKHP